MITNDPKPPASNNFMQRLLGMWQSGTRGKVIIGVGAIIALCFACICITAILPSSPSAQATPDPALLQTQAAATFFAEQTANVPTNTLAPTDTPAPTNTPLPTATSTPPPEPIILSGTGDSVVDVDKWNGPAILRLAHNGSSNFIVYNLDAGGNQIDLLVNKIGQYQGTIPLDFFDSEDTTRFEIKAGGAWEIQVLPLAMVRKETIPGTITGVGDDVVAFEGAGTPDLLKADASTASRNFIVYTFGSSGSDLVINEIAPYTGTVVLDSDTFLIVVTATGSWSMEITVR